MSAAPRRLGLWLPWALFATLALLWCAYWVVLAQGAKQGLQRFVAAQNAAGADISIGAVRTRGFPLQLALDVENIAYASQGRAVQAETPRLVVHINPVNPTHLILAFPARIDLTRYDKPHHITARTLRVSVRLRGRRLARAALAAEDLRMVDEEDGRTDLAADALVINARPDPRAEGDLQIAITLTDATLKGPVRGAEPLGSTIQALNAALVVEQADTLSLRGDPLYAWREAGGRMRVEALQGQWGVVRASGRGWITLDAERRLAGELAMDIEDLSGALAAIAAQPEMTDAARARVRILAELYQGQAQSPIMLRAEEGRLNADRTFVRDLGPLYGAR